MIDTKQIMELEHGTFNLVDGTGQAEIQIQLSIAISLKRIADVIAGNDKHLSLVNGIMEAISAAILQASNR